MDQSTKIICVFRSKTDLFTFIDLAKSYGVMISTVATPKEAKIGCGISAKLDERYLTLSKKLIAQNRFQSFYGIFRVKKQGLRTTTELIYS